MKKILSIILLALLGTLKSQTGSCLNFDGTNDHCIRPPLIGSQNSFLTLEARIAFTGTSSVNQIIVYNGNTSSSGYGLMVFANSNLLTVLYGGFGTVTTTLALTPGTFNLYSLAFGNNTFTVYLNGVNSSTYNAGINPATPISSSGSFVIGANQAGGENFNGSIDEVRLWSRKLCTAEILSRASCQALGSEPGLVACYNFNQGIAGGANSSITSLNDLTPSSNNCTLNNFALTGNSSNWINPAGTLSTSCSSSLIVSAVISPAVSPTICAGSSTTLSASGMDTYNWNTGATSSSISVSPTITTSYSVAGTTTVNGCYGASFGTVVVTPQPTVSIGNFNICSGTTVTLNPSGAATYSYSNGSATLAPGSNTTISITGTSSAGCVSSNTAVSSITVNPNPTITANSGTICSGNSFTINPGGAVSYTISGGATVVSPTVTSSYSVTGTSSLGCMGSAVSSVSVNSTPSVSVNSGSVCSGGSFTLVPSGADTYSYSGGSSVVSPTNLATYTVTGTSTLTGCSAEAVATVSVLASPNVSLSASATTVCVNGSSVTLNGQPSGGVYAGTNVSGTAFTPGAASGTFNPTYSYTAASSGCTGTASVTIVVSSCTGLDKLSANGNIVKMYPNPTNGEVTFDVVVPVKIVISDVLGKTILTESLGTGKQKIDLSTQNNGVYFVKFSSVGNEQTFKLIKE